MSACGSRSRCWGHRAEALELALASLHAPTVAQVLVGVADQAVRLDRPREAARLLSAALAVRGGPDHSRADAARVESAVRAALGETYDETYEPYEEHEKHEEYLTGAARGGAGAALESVRELARVTPAGPVPSAEAKPVQPAPARSPGSSSRNRRWSARRPGGKSARGANTAVRVSRQEERSTGVRSRAWVAPG